MIVLFQGAWTKDCTPEVVSSVRKWHKGVVLFSTWVGQEIPSMDAEVLYLPDPGSGPVQNFKRQVVGLQKPLSFINDDELVLKLRSDMTCPKNPLDFYTPEVCEDMFESKVGVSRIMTRDPKRFPWYISDWVWLGKAKDLKKIASVNPDDAEIVDSSTEATWAKDLNKKYSSLEDPEEFLHANYSVLNTCSDLQMSCLHYPNQPEDHPYYLR